MTVLCITIIACIVAIQVEYNNRVLTEKERELVNEYIVAYCLPYVFLQVAQTML